MKERGTEGTVLLVDPQNMLEERKVNLGMQGSTRIEVTSGLNEGDRGGGGQPQRISQRDESTYQRIDVGRAR